MINFKVIEGKNHKFFIHITNLKTKEDFELYDIVKTVLSRSEFFPFLQGFDKTINYSYLFNEYLFPATFWYDVKTQLLKFNKNIYLENEDILYNNDITREDFNEWLSTKKFPEKIDLENEDYKYQQDSAFLAIQNKIGRIEVSMSGGKTFIAYLYCRYLFENILNNISEDNNKIMIVVPNQSLVKQLQKDFAEFDTYFERKLLVESIFAGSKRFLNADIVCGTFKSLANYEREYFDRYYVFICDELHTAKVYSIRNEIFAKLYNCEYYFGMTGTTPKYKTLDYLHITSMFGRELVNISTKELIDKNIATYLKIKAIRIHYTDYNNFSTNLKENGIIGTQKYKLEKDFFQHFEPRNNIIVKLMKHFVKNSIIMVDNVEYCYYLQEFLYERLDGWKIEVIVGDIKNRSDILDDIRNTPDHYMLIGTHGCISTGISVNNFNYLYYPDGGKSEKRVRQGYGRIMRLDLEKEFGIVFDFQDMIPSCCFKNHARERNKIYIEQQLDLEYIDVTI